MIQKMHILAQWLAFPLDQHSPASSNTPLDIMGSIPHRFINVYPLKVIPSYLARTKMDLSKFPTTYLPHFITSLVHVLGERQQSLHQEITHSHLSYEKERSNHDTTCSHLQRESHACQD